MNTRYAHVTIGFENCDSIDLPISSISFTTEGVKKDCELYGGQYNEHYTCDYARIIIPIRVANRPTPQDELLAEYIKYKHLVQIGVYDDNGKGSSVYLPWVDGDSNEDNIAQHNYYMNTIFGVPSEMETDDTEYIVVSFYDDAIHPEYAIRDKKEVFAGVGTPKLEQRAISKKDPSEDAVSDKTELINAQVKHINKLNEIVDKLITKLGE